MKRAIHPTNVWGEYWAMKCTCKLECTKMPCPIHRRGDYIQAVNDKRAIEGLKKYAPYIHTEAK